MEGVSSNVRPGTSGVPQCTVLRPLLFLIFINDLPESITSSVKVLADNCLVYHSIHSTNDAIQLQGDLDQLGLWVNAWQMTLDLHKCSIMHICNKCNSTKYTINGFPQNCVSGVKYIGAPISSKMSWNDHIDDIVSLELSILVYPSALRCPGATTLTILCLWSKVYWSTHQLQDVLERPH